MTTSLPLTASGPLLDSEVKLRDILQSLPREVFEKNMTRAWLTVATNVVMVGLGYAAIAFSPWYLLPLAWVFTGTALTGFFVLGHDCGHRSFSNNKRLNNAIGHLAFLPLFFPFHGWRILHNYHHKHTNKLEVDNAWDPFTPEAYASNSAGLRWIYRVIRGRFWWVGSIGHWALIHFDWRKFSGKQREQVRFSSLFALVGAAIILPSLVATTGLFGVVKFWLMPWMVYHFWMSTFTIVHHTAPEIPFQTPENWHEARAQLAGSVHCDYPAWVEFLCHDINVHVPHHVCTAIPSYNLRKAHRSLKENWGPYVIETTFSWSLMKEITDRCHIYDPEVNYKSFREVDVTV
jgi:acyl-lipid omega-6 desaturase (Delta-12 desaturase)